MTLFEGSQMCCFLLTLPLARVLDEQVSDDHRSTLFSFLARGASQGYAPQSGEIIGILKQLKDEMSEDLAPAHKEEEANYAGLIAMKEEIATFTATIETKLTRQGDLAVEVGSLKNDVADTQRSLAADQELAAKLAESRSSQSSEWEERQESTPGDGAPCESHTSSKTHALFTAVNLRMWLVASIRDVHRQAAM